MDRIGIQIGFRQEEHEGHEKQMAERKNLPFTCLMFLLSKKRFLSATKRA
jgi:hypothetical protein